MAYTPHTDAQKERMLHALGLERLEQLFEQIPDAVRFHGPLDAPTGLSEIELRRHFRELAAANDPASDQLCFLGAGIYDHYVPSLVGTVVSRGEFYTAYTPYQPEMSQGTLQTIFEFQTMVCALTGMDVANASMYDGASALAEAVIMGSDITGRDRVLLSQGVHPAWREVTATYVDGLGIQLDTVETPRGVTELETLTAAVNETVAAVVIQQPNFFGCVEAAADLAAAAKAAGAIVIVAADPVALGLLEAPGAQGADIVVSEGQPLGLGLNYGGPLVGLFAAKTQHMRRMPGRLVGRTQDHNGRTGYVLTLQTREQHIRRERATSNICTNQGLMMLAATTYLATMGRQGIRAVATQCVQKAHYAAEQIAALPGYSLPFAAPFLKEFTVRCPRPAAEIVRELAAQGILAGYPLSRDYPDREHDLLIAVTEKRTRDEIDQLVQALARA